MSGVRTLKGGRHECQLPFSRADQVVECTNCRKVWVGSPYSRGEWTRRPRWWARMRGWL